MLPVGDNQNEGGRMSKKNHDTIEIEYARSAFLLPVARISLPSLHVHVELGGCSRAPRMSFSRPQI
jgi:hypothetical protein